MMSKFDTPYTENLHAKSERHFSTEASHVVHTGVTCRDYS